MGEFADDEIDRGIDEMAGSGFGYRRPNQNFDKVKYHNFFNSWDGGDVPNAYAHMFDMFEFKEVIRESQKAWLLRMSGDAESWFSKTYCRIKEKQILVPRWLRMKMMEDINNKRNQKTQ